MGANYNFIRIAAISGAAGVCLAAYGRHSMKDDNKSSIEYQKIYESANQMHLIHSVALLATPLTKRPMIVSQQTCSFYENNNDVKHLNISDRYALHNWNYPLQWHLLLQGNPKIKGKRR